jgi:hypothetical protein
MVLGVLVVIVALGADAFGIGGSAGIGRTQALGAVVGLIVVAAGAWFWPGFPQSRMMAKAAALVPASSPTPQKSGATGRNPTPRPAQGPPRSAHKRISVGSRQGGKK